MLKIKRIVAALITFVYIFVQGTSLVAYASGGEILENEYLTIEVSEKQYQKSSITMEQLIYLEKVDKWVK